MGAQPVPSRLIQLVKGGAGRTIAEAVLSLVPSALISLYVPWHSVLSSSIPGGGDNPAHPVLMKSIGEAFFGHGKLVHYSPMFWGGFEAFQFYFPFPYWLGAALSKVMDPNVAFKLVTLLPILLLPAAFYWAARSIRLSMPARFFAGLLAIPFLFTEAHVMWGGNVFSALAGMIGNAWGFVFFVLAFGRIMAAGEENRFSLSAVTFSVLAALSHFYMLLMLVMLYAVFFIQDSYRAFRARSLSAYRWRIYATGTATAGAMAWWAFPLIAYRRFSSELGGDWDIQFLNTFSLGEKVFFAFSVLTLAGFLAFRKSRRPSLHWALLGFLGGYVAFFFFNDIFGTTAFLKNRLWPSIYFAAYFAGVLAIDVWYERLPRPIFAVALAGLWFVIPTDQSFANARSWMEWNYSGLQAKPGWKDLERIIGILNGEPRSRVSYESADEANGTLGSVRTPELIPYLTPHELMLGGIVNSATYAGIGYMMHCLTSETCAGWPPGSIMPDKDPDRAVDLMKALGMRYHISLHKKPREIYGKRADLETLYAGEFAALHRLREPVRMAEAYEGEVPRLCSKRALVAILNLPRWDAWRNTAFTFGRACEQTQADAAAIVNTLAEDWNSGKRMMDLGWASRKDRLANRMNLFLFSHRRKFDPAYSLERQLEFFIGDRGFDPQLFATNTEEGYSEVAVPIVRAEPGMSTFTVNGRGYRMFALSPEGNEEREIPMNSTVNLEVRLSSFAGTQAPFQWLVFKPDLADKYRYIEFSGADPKTSTALPGERRIKPPRRITDECQPRVEARFHELTLTTECPGKPHLVKYSYFPKWKADGVEIHEGTNGFMVLTPKEKTTVIRHRYGAADWLGISVTWLTFAALAYFSAMGFRSRGSSTALQA